MFFKKRKVVDLTEKYHRDAQRAESIRNSMNFARQENAQSIKEQHGISSNDASSSGLGNSNFDFLRNLATTQNQIPAVSHPSETTIESYNQNMGEMQTEQDSVEERRRKLTKRIIDMTEKIENLSTQIYHLQQRLEVVEKKLRVNEFGEQSSESLDEEKQFEGVF